MKRALKWLWDHVDTIGSGCMWLAAAIDLVVLRKLDDACVWVLLAGICTIQNRHRVELDCLRTEANVTRELIGAIVIEQARARVEVEGKLRTRSYEAKDGKRYITEIIAGKITRDGAEREPQIERDDVPERSEDEIPF